MDKKVYISFLVPVFNQVEELRKCIEYITCYKGGDIEIVVNDDCSTDCILEEGLNNLKDSRIKFFRNKKNLGLDGNILEGIKKCTGEFIFLLRTTDYAISDAIPYIIDVIKKNPDVTYITGTSIDDDGIPRIVLRESKYICGTETVDKHFGLHYHPSGSLFRRSALDVESYKKYWLQFSSPRIFFLVEALMRLDMAVKGDFYTVKIPIWKYTYTSRRIKPSVNKKSGRLYDYDIMTERCIAEQEFIYDTYPSELIEYGKIKSFEFNLNIVTWQYLSTVTDKKIRMHYGIQEREIDINVNRKYFVQMMDSIDIAHGFVSDGYKNKKTQILLSNSDYENKYNLIEKRKLYVKKRSEQMVSKLENAKDYILEYFNRNSYERIGLYGMGYLGKIFMKYLIDIGVTPCIISDKGYFGSTNLGEHTKMVEPDYILMYDPDILIITPIHCSNEILAQLDSRINAVSLEDILMNFQNY